MPAEVKEQIQLEVAHVLFVDVVGYSKLSINEQRAVVDELTTLRENRRLGGAEENGKALRTLTYFRQTLCFPSAAAQGRASFRSGEIGILDSTGNLERTIPSTEADRKL